MEQRNLPPSKIAYSIPQAAEASSLSRSLLYEAIRYGELQSIKVRGRRLLLVDDLKNWLTSHRGRA
jgi:excisionase family DNA binding protein